MNYKGYTAGWRYTPSVLFFYYIFTDLFIYCVPILSTKHPSPLSRHVKCAQTGTFYSHSKCEMEFPAH